MKTLFVEHEATELRYERQAILVYKAGERISSIPISGIERVVLSSHITLAAGVLGLFTDSNIALFVFNARHPSRSAYLASGEIGDVRRRIAQYELLKDNTIRCQLSQKIVSIKIRQQRIVLRKAAQKRPELRKPLYDALTTLNAAYNNVATPQTPPTLARLRGIEGAAAACYFKAYQTLFPASFGFSGRNRRPPRDPVNAILSLAYTLIYHESIAALKSAGLDPMLACYHEIYHGRASLACDLVELLRADVENWIWELCQTRTIRHDHFRQQQNACLLNKKGKTYFYETYLIIVPNWRNRLRRYSRFLANFIDRSKINE